MVKRNNCKNHIFENIGLVVFIIVQQGNSKTNFFSFALNLLTEQTIIVSLCVPISGFIKIKKSRLFITSEMQLLGFKYGSVRLLGSVVINRHRRHGTDVLGIIQA